MSVLALQSPGFAQIVKSNPFVMPCMFALWLVINTYMYLCTMIP